MIDMPISTYDYEAMLRRLAPKCREPEPAADSVASEGDLHDQVFDECTRRGWIALHGSMARRTHRTRGEPDFVVLADRGRVLLVECKSRDGKLSVEQQSLKLQAERLGHVVHVVRSLRKFVAAADGS